MPDGATGPARFSARASPPRSRTIAAAIVGNAFEFYDFLVYASFAPTIGRAFFPSSSPSTSLLLSLSIFGVGFVARPLGSIVIGAFADRYGRKPAMMLTIWLMAVGSGLIGIIPTFGQIGFLASLLLLTARLIQGFSAGGEMGSATSFLVESAPPDRVASFGSWQLCSQNMGFLAAALLGAILTATLTAADMDAWGWRIPFLLGAFIAPVGLSIRSRLGETLAVETAHRTMLGVLAELSRDYRLNLVLAMLVISGGAVSQYFFGYVTTYALTTLGFAKVASMLSGVAVGLTGALFALVGGILADRFGVKRMTIMPRIVLTLLFYPALTIALVDPSPAGFILVMSALAAIQAISGAASIVLLPLAFPARIRTTGMSIAYAAGVTVFGGTAQLIFAWLFEATGNRIAPIWYVLAMNLVSIVATLYLQISDFGERAVNNDP